MYVINTKTNKYINLDYFSDFHLCECQEDGYNPQFYTKNSHIPQGAKVFYGIFAERLFDNTRFPPQAIIVCDTKEEAENCLGIIRRGLLIGLSAVEV